MPRFSCCRPFLFALTALALPVSSPAQSVTFGGTTFVNRGLVGVGRVSASQRDRFGETLGSFSGLALDPRSWRRNADGSFAATLFTQPDRGYVRSGVTTNYRPRLHQFSVTFTPAPNGSSNQNQLRFTLSDTVLFAEANGTPLTSLDPSPTGSGTRSGFPPLPQAHNGRLSIDPEGLARLGDGTFFVSDEYGPYLYRFSANGALLGAVRPPEAFIPKRNAQESFSSNNPGDGQPAPSPADPLAGRANNQGFEGLSLSPDGTTLYALLQSALRQEGGAEGGAGRRYTRLLAYDVANPAAPVLRSEWILPLPLYTEDGGQHVASVGDLVALSARHFLVLTRDGNGRGSASARSLSRAVLVYDTAAATNLAGSAFDNPNNSAAPRGVLSPTIVPATSVVLVDINDLNQLTKFNLNNSSNDNSDTLAEKWESLALTPALDPSAPDDFFLLIGNDNDFSTTDGRQNGESYRASLNIDNMVLVYRVSIPGIPTLPAFIAQPANVTVSTGQSATLVATAVGNPAPSLQWRRNGQIIPGATASTLALSNVQVGDAGAYTATATNSLGSVTSSTATLTVSGTNAPTFSAQPQSQTIARGSTAVFSAAASNSPTYQWQRNGAPLAGATSRMLVLPAVEMEAAGTYVVFATNASGTVASSPATLTVVGAAPADVGRLSNLSIRTTLSSADPSFTLGTVVGGAGTSGEIPLLVRAAGPSLAPFGIADALADPQVEMLSGTTVVARNDNWGDGTGLSAVFAQVGAFAFVSPTSRDAALYSASTPARDYTVQVSGVGSGAGTVLAELYEATPAATFGATTPRLINVSVRKQIAAGGSLTAGFVIGGATARTVLVRAIGPRLALAPFNLPGAMVDPKLDLYSEQTVIAANDNWGGDPQLTATANGVGAFLVSDPASRDAMLLATLAPGPYTAVVSGSNNAGGLAIVEVYEVP
jgi:hypothetical protein